MKEKGIRIISYFFGLVKANLPDLPLFDSKRWSTRISDKFFTWLSTVFYVRFIDIDLWMDFETWFVLNICTIWDDKAIVELSAKHGTKIIVLESSYRLFITHLTEFHIICQRKNKRLTSLIAYIFNLLLLIPYQRSISTQYLSILRLQYYKCVLYITTFFIKFLNRKLIIWSSVE